MSIQSTILTRLEDGLPLAASVEDEHNEQELSQYKKQAKQLARKLNAHSEPEMSIDYLIEGPVCYLVIATKSYPRKLAFTYLADLAKEFSMQHTAENIISSSLRPYAFQAFDTFITATKRVYQDSRANQSLDRLNSDLKDVTRIMTKNIEDLLYRGDSLDKMSELSGTLRDESLKYKRTARQINIWAIWQQYGPVGIIIFVLILVIYWRFFW